MSGIKSSVASEILLENPITFSRHCFGHALNVAAGNEVKNNGFLGDTEDTEHTKSQIL